MTVSIIGSGPSGKDWFNTPADLSIGCNDCAKWGKDPDWLILVNRSFQKDREAVIKATRPKKVFTTIEYWRKHFREVSENLRLQQFGKHLRKGHVYCSKTSPFIAMSLAFNAHATDIILFGVDLNSHPVIKGKLLNYELRQWQRFCSILKGYGVNVWVSSNESRLSEFLPVWVTEYCSESHCPTFNYIFDHQQIDCKEISNYWKSIKLEPEDNNRRDFINRTIKDYSVEIEGLGLKDGEWGLGYMEVIKKDDKEIILKSTHSEFTATIDLTSAKAIQEFCDMKIGDRFKVVATIGI